MQKQIGNYGGYMGAGVSNYFWIHIITPTILRKYNYKCANCPSTKNLHIHHTDYVNQNINTLVVLCPKCHKAEHKEEVKE